MINPSSSIVLGFVFVLVGGMNVWLVLEAWSRVKAAKASARMIALHRIGGYVFIALFFVMSYFMVARIRNAGADTSPTVTLHVALAMILSPLLFIKVLIARYYKNQLSLLTPIGLTIFVLAFVLVASTAAPYLVRVSKTEEVSIDPAHGPVTIDLIQASDLMQKRCSKCHNLDRVVGARKDAQGWLETVERMRARPDGGISEADSRLIVSYLASQYRPEDSGAAAMMEIERALVDQRCSRCHNLDRVFMTVQTADEWRDTVTRMADYAAGSTAALRTEEQKQIINYLSGTQTPEAVKQRNAQVDSAFSTGPEVVARTAATGLQPPIPSSQYNAKTIGFMSLVALGMITLIVRRPRPREAAPPPAAPPVVPAAAPATAPVKPIAASKSRAAVVPRPPNNPFLLELVQINQQTPDTKTLRFALHGQQQLGALPGQFLTFSFLFDGKKEKRCYSICSSPAQPGYVEITPKRVDNGCVSVFLNDRATVGMTVEATGPSGKFYFDAVADTSIVLLAAGSGITPMMAMVRYIDDLGLATEVTLLYCVRTSRDIIFRQELDEMRTRIKNFRYHVLLSQPDPEWVGARGHISREFIGGTIPEVTDRGFFLCGPPPFMEAARRILLGMGVQPERIRQEMFGGVHPPPKIPESPTPKTAFQVEFARSGIACSTGEDQTLLQAAAENGVEIPSACRQGQCGTCKTRLLDGRVRMTAEQGLDPESKGQGFVLTCVGHADGNVKLDA